MVKTIDLDNIVTDNEVFMTKVLALFDSLDQHDMLFWRADEGRIKFFVNCSDTFHWATADMEEITPENFPVLLRSSLDVQVADPGPGANTWAGPILFCARQRRLRPMPRMEMPENLRPLFDACGPVRTGNDFVEYIEECQQ